MKRSHAFALAVACLCLAAPAVAAGQAVDPMWDLNDVNAPAAWELSTGAGATVAVVDTGIEDYHPAFGGRVTGGWGFDGTTDDLYGHGTAVAGVIAGALTGVAPGARLIPFRALRDDDVADANAVLDALDRAGASGARVVNASISTEPYYRAPPADFDAVAAVLAAHPDTLYVTSAGNSGNDNDERPTLPCNVAAANLLCVGAYDQKGALLSSSNYGASTVDVLAPGALIRTTRLGGSYGYTSFEGTSLATAFVSGEAALLFAKVPRLTVAQAIDLIRGTVRRDAGFASKSAAGGRLDAYAALQTATVDSDGDGVPDLVDNCPADPNPTADGCPAPPPPPPSPTPTAYPSPSPTPAPAATPPPRQERVPRVKSLKAKVSKCKGGGRSCKKTATVQLMPDRTAKVSLRVERRACDKRRRCRWTRVLTKAFTASTRGASVVVKRPKGLSEGTYRVVAVLSSSGGAARPETRTFTVR